MVTWPSQSPIRHLKIILCHLPTTPWHTYQTFFRPPYLLPHPPRSTDLPIATWNLQSIIIQSTVVKNNPHSQPNLTQSIKLLTTSCLRSASHFILTTARTQSQQQKTKTSTPRIPMWSPTMVLTKRCSAWLRRSDGMRYFLSPMAEDTNMFLMPSWTLDTPDL